MLLTLFLKKRGENVENIEVFKIAMLKKSVGFSEIANLINMPVKEIENWFLNAIGEDLPVIEVEKLFKIADYLGLERNDVFDMNTVQRIDSVKTIQVIEVRKVKRSKSRENFVYAETEYWDLDGKLIGKRI